MEIYKGDKTMDLKRYMANQLAEALKYKWCKGEEIHCDPGEAAITEWITQHAAEYRQEYEQCFKALTMRVIDSINNRMDTIAPECNHCMDKDKIFNVLIQEIIDEFTRQWVLEMAKPDHDRHVEEI